MSDTPAAGWYPDPEDATQQRYWDGAQWTEHRAPLSGGQAPVSGQAPAGGQQDWSAGGGFSAGGGGFASGGGYGQPGGGQVAYGGAPVQNQKALWALILGILGLVCCGIFAAVPALILGNTAKKEIAASGGTQSGEGMAQAGFILGIVGIVLSVLVFVGYLLFGLAAVSAGF